jgi:hypothetical protein
MRRPDPKENIVYATTFLASAIVTANLPPMELRAQQAACSVPVGIMVGILVKNLLQAEVSQEGLLCYGVAGSWVGSQFNPTDSQEFTFGASQRF